MSTCFSIWKFSSIMTFSGGGGKPSCPSPSAEDLREWNQELFWARCCPGTAHAQVDQTECSQGRCRRSKEVAAARQVQRAKEMKCSFGKGVQLCFPRRGRKELVTWRSDAPSRLLRTLWEGPGNLLLPLLDMHVPGEGSSTLSRAISLCFSTIQLIN